MYDHLTLKKLKALLPPESYGRIAAADVVHKMTGENLVERLKCNIGIDRNRIDTLESYEYFERARIKHLVTHGLGQETSKFTTIKASSDHDIGKGKLSHFHVDDAQVSRFVDQRILGELVVPKANLHLVGPLLAELDHTYARQRAEWERSGTSRRNRIRNVRRLRAVRKLCRAIPRKHLEIESRFSKRSDSTFRLRDARAETKRLSFAPLSYLRLIPEDESTLKFNLTLSKLRHRRIYRKLLAVIAEERAWEIKEGGK